MSLLDTQFPELDLFLQTWRRRLNRVIVAAEALTATVVAAPVAAVIAVGGVRVASQRWWVWATLTVLTVALWTLWRSRRRLTADQSAAWLDERCATEGLFSAATHGLAQQEPTAVQRQVLVRAEQSRPQFTGRGAPRLPRRRLVLRFVAAVVVAGASAALLSVTLPGTTPGSITAAPAASAPPEAGAKNEPAAGTKELSPHDAAQRLFPEDQRLAALAEQALASGDPGALEALLEQNAAARGSGQGAPSPKGSSPQDRDRTGDESAGAESGERAPGGSGQPQSRGAPGSEPSKPGDNASKTQGPGQNPAGEAGGGTSQSTENLGSKGGAEGSQAAGEGTRRPFSSGGAPGFGHSEQPVDKPVTPRSGAASLPLKEPGAQGLFEYVLPGSEAKRPTADTVASSARSAEAVLSRTSPPLEFETTIRDYFLSLSQEAKP